VSGTKASGATYTPELLADFVADQMLLAYDAANRRGPIRILDPAVGDGALLMSLLRHLREKTHARIEIQGFDTDPEALDRATERLVRDFPWAHVSTVQSDFLEYVANQWAFSGADTLFGTDLTTGYDLVIANPPYVRTQIMGAKEAQRLAKAFGLKGRIDLYHAFLIAIASVLKPHGVLGGTCQPQ
jgi:adenine-specific DNA-methyltransferase